MKNYISQFFKFSDVAQPGFCTTFCGWHTYSGDFKYSWVGIPATGCACFAQTTSPNGDAAVDAAVSVIAHELMETATDPLLDAWFDASGNENGDACAWNFVDSVSDGDYNYNLVVGNLKYYVQANYNLGSQTCTMS
jgi:Phosphate-induced protein 1 conserved region